MPPSVPSLHVQWAPGEPMVAGLSLSHLASLQWSPPSTWHSPALTRRRHGDDTLSVDWLQLNDYTPISVKEYNDKYKGEEHRPLGKLGPDLGDPELLEKVRPVSTWRRAVAGGQRLVELEALRQVISALWSCQLALRQVISALWSCQLALRQIISALWSCQLALRQVISALWSCQLCGSQNVDSSARMLTIGDFFVSDVTTFWSMLPAGLVGARAKNERLKEISRNIKEANMQKLKEAAAKPKREAPKAVSARQKAMDFARQVPKPAQVKNRDARSDDSSVAGKVVEEMTELEKLEIQHRLDQERVQAIKQQIASKHGS
ncbi:hypothetical protein CYMTET_19369 [Cymbomonas tetramitiformis]|uniref:Uncharacterized protein n=1 Tax=Cymbomonas tetramitiformis TaxID=36881 RepID=A0AAE0G662_9CHLO|nr:hypothetical protein CYMTET_19369 [Cymbomonas tetramitiformis]